MTNNILCGSTSDIKEIAPLDENIENDSGWILQELSDEQTGLVSGGLVPIIVVVTSTFVVKAVYDAVKPDPVPLLDGPHVEAAAGK